MITATQDKFDLIILHASVCKHRVEMAQKIASLPLRSKQRVILEDRLRSVTTQLLQIEPPAQEAAR